MRRVPRTRWGQAGGATIELTGVTAAAAVLVVAVLLAGASGAPGVGDRFRWALCKVTTLGQGACGTPTSPAAHVPPQPCVVQSDTRSLRTEVAVLVVTAANGRRFEVARLSDGRYRVTQLLSDSVGLETGIGGGVTVTVNDRTVGGSATAEAGVALDMASGRVWYTRDPREVQRMLSEDGEDAVETAVIGSGPVRSLWEAGQDGVGWITGNGDYDLPDADETYAEAGVVGNAEAEITGGADRAGASGTVTRVLGTRTTRNGSTTVYFRSTVQGAAGVQLLGGDGFEGSEVAGGLDLVTAATYDAGGVLREVSVTAVADGESKGAVSALFGGSGDPSLSNNPSGAVVYQATVPVRDATDRQVAVDFLVASGIRELGPVALAAGAAPAVAGATIRFLDTAADRGYTTRQTFDTENTTEFAVNAEGKLGLELGANVSVDSASRTSTGAEYWDGSRWVARRECNG